MEPTNNDNLTVLDITLMSSGPATLRVAFRCKYCLHERAAIFDSQQRLTHDCQWCRHCGCELNLTAITERSGLFRQLPERHPDDICSACRGSGHDVTREGSSKHCTECDGTGNAKVAEAAEGEAKCGKRIGRCGGSCVRTQEHKGLCLCEGDDGLPEGCPA